MLNLINTRRGAALTFTDRGFRTASGAQTSLSKCVFQPWHNPDKQIHTNLLAAINMGDMLT